MELCVRHLRVGVVFPSCIKGQTGMGAGLVYGVLLDYCGQKNFCWPSQKRIARDLGVSVRTVQTWLAELEEKGFIAIRRRTVGNVYTVLPHPAVLAFLESEPAKNGMPVEVGGHANGSECFASRIKEEKIHTPHPPTPPAASCMVCAAPDAGGSPNATKSARLKPDAEPDFERIWQAWPIQEARKSALRLWQRLKRLGQLPAVSRLLELVRAHSERNPRWQRGYVPYLVTWLKGRRWEDEIPAETQKASGQASAAHLKKPEKAVQASTPRGLLQRENAQTGPVAPLDEVSPEASQRLEKALALWPVKPTTPGQQSWARGLWRYLTRSQRLPDQSIIQEASVNADVTFAQWLHNFCLHDTRRGLENFAT